MPRAPRTTAAPLIPNDASLPSLRTAASRCTACPIGEKATQTVFGEGQTTARLMLVGEQPGDKEDIAGKPFVGPAGQLLDDCLTAAGIDRAQAYVTNVVKHFKFELRGKRRIHAKPGVAEIAACKPWLHAEIASLKPTVIVCLGSTAAQALLGKDFRVTAQRGTWVPSALAPHVMATVHPSALLREIDPQRRKEDTERLIDDLRKVVPALKAATG